MIPTSRSRPEAVPFRRTRQTGGRNRTARSNLGVRNGACSHDDRLDRPPRHSPPPAWLAGVAVAARHRASCPGFRIPDACGYRQGRRAHRRHRRAAASRQADRRPERPAGQTGFKQTSLANEIATTKQNLTGVRTSIDEIQAEIDGLGGQLADVTARYSSLVVRQNGLRLQLIELTAEGAAKQLQLNQRQAILASRLVAAYETDQTPLLQQLLTAHSLTEALSDVSYYGEPGRRRQGPGRPDQARPGDLWPTCARTLTTPARRQRTS